MGWKNASYSGLGAVIFSFGAVFILSLILLDSSYNFGIFSWINYPTSVVFDLLLNRVSIVQTFAPMAIELLMFGFTFGIYFIGGIIVGGLVGKVINQFGIHELKKSIKE